MGGDPKGLLRLRATLAKTDHFPVDLITVLRLVARHNLWIEQAKANQNLAAAQTWLTAAGFLPSLPGSFVESELKGSTQSFTGSILIVKRKTIQPQIEADWTLYPGGTAVFQTLAARQLYKSAVFQTRATVQQQLASAAVQYYSLLQTTLLERNAEQSLKEADQQVRLTQGRYEGGIGTRLDWTQAKTTQAQQLQALITAQNNTVQAEQTLLYTLDLPPSVSLEPMSLRVDLLTLIPDETPVDQLVAVARQNSPTLQQTESLIKSYRQSQWAALSAIIPSVALRSYINKTGSTWGNLTTSKFNGLNITAGLLQGLGLTIPLQGWQANITRKNAELARLIAIRTLEQQVVDSAMASRNLKDSMTAARQQLDFAQDTYTQTKARYMDGLEIYLNVLTAELNVTNARNNLTTAVVLYNQAQVQLVQSLGLATPEALIRGVQVASK